MICPKCGRNNTENSAFCINCGVQLPVDVSAPADAAVPPPAVSKKFSKKHVIIGIVSLLVLAAVFVAIVFAMHYTSPISKMERAVSDGDFTTAWQLYMADLYGEALPDSVLTDLKAYVDDVQAKFESEEIDYNNAQIQLNELNDLCDVSGELATYVSTVRESIQNQNQCQQLMKNGDKYYNDGAYLEAINAYKSALAYQSDSQKAAEGVEKAQAAYRKKVLAEADAYIAKRDYQAAEETLAAGIAKLGEDSELRAKLDGLTGDEVAHIVSDAYSYTESGDWDSAVELLEEAQETHAANAAILEAYEDIKAKMPITLKNITTVSSDRISVTKDVIKDRYGNIYDGGVLYNADGDAFGLYNLAGRYTAFKATAFPSMDVANDVTGSISIYADEELVYYKDGISNETPPFEISLDLSGKNTLRVVVKRTASWRNMYIYFGNSTFEKVQTAESESESSASAE